MDYYGFAVTNFQISDTRSLHEDTLHLGHAIFADGDMIDSSTVTLGDFNNGDYQTQNYVHGGQKLGLTAVINDPQVEVSFLFQLINADHVPGDLDGRFAATADALSGIVAGVGGPWGYVAAGVLEASANLYAWLEGNCDGPVAVDQMSGPRYVIDAWADDDPTGSIITTKRYPGTDSPHGCGGNSNYQVTWYVQHYQGWSGISDDTQNHQLRSGTGVSAATHNGAVHVFGVMPGPAVTHGRTFTGTNWYVDSVPVNSPSDLQVSAVSFNDRLYIVGARADGSIWPQAFTTDGGSWDTPTTHPAGLQTNEPIATAVFKNRLYVFARSAADNSLQVTSTSDLIFWTGWAIVPNTGLVPSTPVAAAALGDRLYIFGVSTEAKGRPEGTVVVSNATSDGSTWTGWRVVEAAGARPEGQPLSDHPLDVAATTFDDRIYIASRWKGTGTAGKAYIAVNFSADGDNWAGWREPPSPTLPLEPSATPGLAGVSNHLYILTPAVDSPSGDNTMVWVY